MGKTEKEKTPVTLHLSAEAAEILKKYGGERNRGWLVSVLLLRFDESMNDSEQLAIMIFGPKE